MGLSRTNSSHHCININNSIKHPGLITTPLTLIIWYGSLPYKRLKVGLGVDFRKYAAFSFKLVDFGLLVLVAVGSGDYLFNQPSQWKLKVCFLQCNLQHRRTLRGGISHYIAIGVLVLSFSPRFDWCLWERLLLVVVRVVSLMPII